jgi:hypothetical protein
MTTMPLVHRLSGTGFASGEAGTARLRERPATIPGHVPVSQASGDPAHCPLCARRASVFDLSMRCCLERYESLFGSVHEHRSMFTRAKISALFGDLGPARRLVESYRRVFGPLAAVELRRTLWQSIAEARSRPVNQAVGPPAPGAES